MCPVTRYPGCSHVSASGGVSSVAAVPRLGWSYCFVPSFLGDSCAHHQNSSFPRPVSVTPDSGHGEVGRDLKRDDDKKSVEYSGAGGRTSGLVASLLQASTLERRLPGLAGLSSPDLEHLRSCWCFSGRLTPAPACKTLEQCLGTFAVVTPGVLLAAHPSRLLMSPSRSPLPAAHAPG